MEHDDARVARIETALRPCPHCGPMPAMPELVLGDLSRRWQVFCGPCGSSSGSSRDPQGAADSWNSRHVAGPEIATSSAAVTTLALMLGNSLADLSPSTEPPIHGFRSDEVRLRSYDLAHGIVALINAQRRQAAAIEESIRRA